MSMDVPPSTAVTVTAACSVSSSIRTRVITACVAVGWIDCPRRIRLYSLVHPPLVDELVVASTRKNSIVPAIPPPRPNSLHHWHQLALSHGHADVRHVAVVRADGAAIACWPRYEVGAGEQVGRGRSGGEAETGREEQRKEEEEAEHGWCV
jgi:hypothetical protein